MAMKFQDCYKVLIQSLTDWTNWTGKYAQLIDACDDSDDENITLYTWNPVASDKTSYWIGDGTATSGKCLPGKVFAPNVHAFVFEALLSYFNVRKS